MNSIYAYLAVPLLPLIASFCVGILGRKLPEVFASSMTITSVFFAFVLSCITLNQTLSGLVLNQTIYQWLLTGHYQFEVGFLIDNLTAMMMVVVTFVSLMVHIYTMGYMKGDPGYRRFFSYISLFTFSMLMLVMSNNFMQLFFGWEAVGLVSYLLIGFWFERPTAIYANLKAFLVNRVGDFGFILGIALILYWTGSLDYATVFKSTGIMAAHTMELFGQPVNVVTVICILLFIGAMGKSAQVPLHVWLPDSMEGPTPISALIHAATMVTAGIFMVARTSPLFELSDTALSFVMIIGAITALFMGLLGIIQNDIKRVIAYSTLSQLGYMTVALGASAYSVAMFHLMTHAFFKALLFLGAGSVIIGMHHDQNIQNMGNLKKYMPITWITFLIGSLALIGTPLFSGFYSKDSLIEAVKLSNISGSHFAYFSVLVGVFVTAFYSFRLYFLVFHGKEKWRLQKLTHHDGHHHGLTPKDNPHESPLSVTLPLVLLAIPSVVIGFITIEPILFGSFLSKSIFLDIEAHPTMELLSHHFHEIYHGPFGMALHSITSLPFLFALSGVALAYYCYEVNLNLPKTIFNRTQTIYRVLENKYGFDSFNEKFFAFGSRFLGDKFWQIGDVKIIDGWLVNGTAKSVSKLAEKIRVIQSGYIYHYAFAMVIGVFLFLTFFIKI
ncbi:NADH-quinone oxidoreductase subunit L [Candidatus Methylopumilus universalis]|uniref:NADH-quinone oxidoreductase subunit L n=1 Tax=Candidatus Methylopumilus universalis TaxID=2588536 RepID=UPI003BEEFAE0